MALPLPFGTSQLTLRSNNFRVCEDVSGLKANHFLEEKQAICLVFWLFSLFLFYFFFALSNYNYE